MSLFIFEPSSGTAAALFQSLSERQIRPNRPFQGNSLDLPECSAGTGAGPPAGPQEGRPPPPRGTDSRLDMRPLPFWLSLLKIKGKHFLCFDGYSSRGYCGKIDWTW